MAPIGVANVRAKRCHLDLRSILNHQNHAEFRAHVEAARKKFLNAVWARVRANVVIRRLAPQLKIAHTPAHEIRLMPVMAQRRADLFGQFTRGHS